MIKNETLEKWLIQMRRIAEHRESNSMRNIRRIYRELYKELQSYLSNEYVTYAVDEQLSIAQLQMNARYARFLEEIVSKTNYFTPQIEEEIMQMVIEVYEQVYNDTVDIVKKATETELDLATQLAGLTSVPREVVIEAINNPIYGLTLSDLLEKHRAEIIYDIKRNITIGLMNNDRYSTMAKRIAKTLDGDYEKSIRIVRTEAHRVRESGSFNAANDINETMKLGSSGYRMVKRWKTMKDERVRKTKKANHVKMDGKITEMDGYFDLGRGVKTLIPGNSGDAANDINCRCICLYNISNK